MYDNAEVIEAIKTELAGFIQESESTLEGYELLKEFVSQIIEKVTTHIPEEVEVKQKTLDLHKAVGEYITKLKEGQRTMKCMLRKFELKGESITDADAKQGVMELIEFQNDIEERRNSIDSQLEFFKNKNKGEDFQF